MIGTPARPQATGTTLLRPDAISYAADGGYSLAHSPKWTSLSFDLFTPLATGQSGARFGHMRLSYGGNKTSENFRLSLGQAWRHSMGPNQVLGFNSYLDLGRKQALEDPLIQASLGMEYELARPGWNSMRSLRMGSNLYLPLADYTDPRYDPGTHSVPRRGVDTYLSVQQNVSTGMNLGARVSMFHYPETATRDARGIGTLALTSRIENGLPEGSAIVADVSGRFTPGETVTPTVRLEYRRARPTTRPPGKRTIGSLQPSRACKIVPGDRRIDRLDCGSGTYTARKKHEVYNPEGGAIHGTVTVPAPRRHLAYGTLYIP